MTHDYTHIDQGDVWSEAHPRGVVEKMQNAVQTVARAQDQTVDPGARRQGDTLIPPAAIFNLGKTYKAYGLDFFFCFFVVYWATPILMLMDIRPPYVTTVTWKKEETVKKIKSPSLPSTFLHN